ncbi:MAG: TIM barrel protein [Anaerolineae bacterium]|nr:TIM barrel protein [Anaerolineae bacterium]
MTTPIKQSFVWSCFARDDTPAEKLVSTAASIGYRGVELVEPEYWQLIHDHGLEIAAVTAFPLAPEGLNRRENLPDLERPVRDRLDLAVKWHIPTLLVFSGNRYGVDPDTAAQITAENLRQLAEFAAQAKVTLVLELLNSKLPTRNYEADNSGWGVKVCELVNSPYVKLLYDIFHMQIMEGDIINTIRQRHAYFAHYHTAGNPGRHDLDDTQELNYPPIVRAILESGYQGYLGHEFHPLGDPLLALKAAFDTCDVT